MLPRPITVPPPRWSGWRILDGAVRDARCIATLLAVLCAAGARAAEPAAGMPATATAAAGMPATGSPAAQFPQAQRDFILACGGCHGLTGVSNSSLVPSLKGLVGYYLYLPEGRAYLPRLPNVAFSTLNDEQLAAVLNYMVFDLGAGSVPAGTRPYRAVEVGKWRRQPLTEVTLSEYRRQMVEILIARYHAPETLRGYSAAGQ
jgi:cytochrome c553